jgi:hypothetical protein
LRLDQSDEISVSGDSDSVVQLANRISQGQVGKISCDDVDLIRDELPVEGGEVRPLQADDPRILAKRSQKLPEPGIDCVDPRRARSEQHPREPSGRSTEVEGDSFIDRDLEPFERGCELYLSTKRLLAADRDRGVQPNERRRVVDHATVNDHQPRQDCPGGICE